MSVSASSWLTTLSFHNLFGMRLWVGLPKRPVRVHKRYRTTWPSVHPCGRPMPIDPVPQSQLSESSGTCFRLITESNSAFTRSSGWLLRTSNAQAASARSFAVKTESNPSTLFLVGIRSFHEGSADGRRIRSGQRKKFTTLSTRVPERSRCFLRAAAQASSSEWRISMSPVSDKRY